MDFGLHVFLLFSVVYAITLAFHFTYLTLHEKNEKGRGQSSHGHDLVAGTPINKYLRHSHRTWAHPGGNGSGLAKIQWEDDAHAELKCAGGDGSEQELVYWHKPTPQDDNWTSPWQGSEPPKYVTFESDNGGWNNGKPRNNTLS